MAQSEKVRTGGRWLLVAACVFVALLPFLYHLRFFSGQHIVYDYDSAQLHYPRYKILCDALQQEGQLPLWQTWLYAGSPFHANPENPTLYPPVLLFARFTTPIWAINLTILTHLSLAALGMFLLVRRLWSRVDREGTSSAVAIGGAMVAAVVFSLSLWTRLDHLNLVTYGATHALIPWILLAAEALLHGPRPLRAAGCLGLLFGYQVQSGGLYVIPYAAMALAAWILCFGLFGGRERAKRALTYGLLAGVTALLIVAGKYFPYAEWVTLTNRADQLDYRDALGKTLGGKAGSFEWSEVLKKLTWYTFYGASVFLALLSLPLLRSGIVRVALVLVAFFFAIGLGGPLHRFLYDYLPIFDQVRNADRAWSGVNAFLPVLAGLGTCWVLSRFSRLRQAPLSASLVGGALALGLSPMMYSSFRFAADSKSPESFDELLSRYTQWPDAAKRCGSEWRAMYVDRTTPERRNEQFISTALEVETPAGYLGHVWPRDLERHLYGLSGTPLTDEQRFRRRSTLSVRWMVSYSHAPGLKPIRDDILPREVDGNTLLDNELVRPRAVEPSVVAAVYGDADCEVMYTMLDSGTFPIQEATVLQLRDDRELSRQECLAIEALVLRGEPSAQAKKTAETMRALNKHVVEVGAELSASDLELIHAVEHKDLATTALGVEPGHAKFTRRFSDSTIVERADSTRGRWLVVSEPWSIYQGWSVRAISGAELPIDRADGVSSAIFVPVGESSFRAEYAPRSVKIGLWYLAAGSALGLLLLLWPARTKT